MKTKSKSLRQAPGDEWWFAVNQNSDIIFDFYRICLLTILKMRSLLLVAVSLFYSAVGSAIESTSDADTMGLITELQVKLRNMEEKYNSLKVSFDTDSQL